MWAHVTPCSASNAVDGITVTQSICEGLAISAEENDPWWIVDLGMSTEIDKVVIWNRVNCCTERMSNAAILLLDGDSNTVGQVPDIGYASGTTTIELYAADFVLPTEMPSFLPSSVSYMLYHFCISIIFPWTHESFRP